MITWEQRKLSELVQIERGGSPRPIEAYITDAPNGLNWVKIGDAPVQGHYITKTAEKIKPEGLSKTRQVQPGDLILSNSMSFGKPYIMGIDGCIHDGWLLIRDNKKAFDLTFLYHLLGTPQMLSQYKSLAAGSTVNNLNKELVGGTIVTIPNLDEQQVLGQYLESLDNLITLHQRKYNLCNKVKVYAWEQRKLGELTIYRNGTGHEEKQSESGKYELINLNSISIDGGLKPSGKFIDEETETLLKDDLVMVLSDVGHGDLLGRVAIIPENNRFVLNQRVALLRNNSSVDIKYLFSYINAHQIYFKKQGAGSSQLNISRGSVENFEVLLPHKDEQKKIGKYLSSIDNLITLHQRKKKYTKKPIILLKITF
ncbi:restriction endonuclease subunit S [Amedibacterium intestinale]|uniref:restriction endonuclease subunit S n=1 Tax=Amedibacterium intestinale TaxID=2583452 RepID=UPI002FD7EB78